MLRCSLGVRRRPCLQAIKRCGMPCSPSTRCTWARLPANNPARCQLPKVATGLLLSRTITVCGWRTSPTSLICKHSWMCVARHALAWGVVALFIIARASAAVRSTGLPRTQRISSVPRQPRPAMPLWPRPCWTFQPTLSQTRWQLILTNEACQTSASTTLASRQSSPPLQPCCLRRYVPCCARLPAAAAHSHACARAGGGAATRHARFCPPQCPLQVQALQEGQPCPRPCLATPTVAGDPRAIPCCLLCRHATSMPSRAPSAAWPATDVVPSRWK